MRLVASFLTLAFTLTAMADPVQDVFAAESAFAKAFADRDKAKFFSLVADDAVFLSALGTLRGKEQVVSRWSRFFEGPEAPFSWGPERVEITAGGTIGFSMGPIYDPRGKHAGFYSSIWQKQKDGAWKVVVDGPGTPGAPLPETTAKLEEGHVTTPDGVQLFYRKLGSGPVTLIVPLDYALHDAFRQFADIATIITYDPRNRGRSSRAADEATWTIEQDLRDLETVRAHFKADKFIPVGFSYLGKLVANYAAAYPQHVSRVVQLGPGANDAAAAGVADRSPTGVPAEDEKAVEALRAAGAPEKNPREFCEAWWKSFRYVMVGDPKYAGRYDMTGCEHENEWGVNFNRTFAKLWPTIEASKLSEAELGKITMPVLTIHGTKDRNASYEGGRLWAAALPDARLVTIDGAAHAMWLEDPVTVFGAIRHFIRGEWPIQARNVTAVTTSPTG
jgi:pimeloyl-ACP methyl ester carboxylesterase/ketosteroid isomerase-like protein